ncbi:peptidoglycan/LPS O-acetylase OafA/YrhL [Bradyrhizobium sp. GM24.11]
MHVLIVTVDIGRCSTIAFPKERKAEISYARTRFQRIWPMTKLLVVLAFALTILAMARGQQNQFVPLPRLFPELAEGDAFTQLAGGAQVGSWPIAPLGAMPRHVRSLG